MYIYFVEKSFFDKNCIYFFNEKLKIILQLYNCLDIFMIALKKEMFTQYHKVRSFESGYIKGFSNEVLYIDIKRELRIKIESRA